MHATLEADGTILLGGAQPIAPAHPAYPDLAELYRATSGVDPCAMAAKALAQTWTEREAAGDEPTDAELDQAAAMLAPLGHVVEFTGALWQIRTPQSLSLSQGGIVAAGSLYRGGRWVSLSQARAEFDSDEAEPEGDAGQFLAELYAALWSHWEADGREPTPAELEEAAAELEPVGWVVAFTGDGWQAHPAGAIPLSQAQARAPIGGVTINGKFYRGGRWIPAAELAKATPEVLAKIEAAKKDAADKRRARGPVDSEALKAKLAPHADVELTATEVASAKRAYHALKRHHGELLAHRLDELAGELHQALERLPEDESGQREALRRQLRTIGQMHEWAEAGGTPSSRQKIEDRVGTLPDGRTVSFVPHPGQQRYETTILVDARALDAAWASSSSEYIPPGGGGAEIEGRRSGFESFLAEGKPVEAPRVSVSLATGNVSFADGRHRFSVLRDHGIDQVAITVPKDQVAEIYRQLSAAAPGKETQPWAGDAPDFHKVYNAPVEALHVDPERFQFKLNTDKSGVTQELKGVEHWNPDFAGVLAVWKDPADGKTYVVNGHHRRELAGRLGVKDMAVRYIDAPDAKQARAVGALINIAEGRGTAVDAAKFMRDTGSSPEDLAREGVSLKGRVAADAAVLTKLNDRLFDRVARGTLDQAKALAIAKHLEEPLLQDKLASLLDKREDEKKEVSPRVIEEMARALKLAGTIKTVEEGGLFGDIEAEDSLFEPRAELAAYVRGELSKAVNDFLAVASKRRAEVVGKAGNVLDTEANRQIAEEAERAKNVYDTLVNRKGPISDALNDSAAELVKAKGKKARDAIRERALERVRQAVVAELGEQTDADGTEPVLPGSAAPRGGEPSGSADTGAVDRRGSAPEPSGLSPAAEQPATSPLTHGHIKQAQAALRTGKLGAKGDASSPLITSDLTGLPIRRYVELPSGHKVHPDELARAIKGDGDATELGPEQITVTDPLNRGADTQPSFERALATVAAYRGHDDDRVTLQSPHGYTVTRTRGEWRALAQAAKERPEAMAQWYDRENPEPVSAAARESKAGGAKLAGEKESEAFFAPQTEPGPGLFARPDLPERHHGEDDAASLSQADTRTMAPTVSDEVRAEAKRLLRERLAQDYPLSLSGGAWDESKAHRETAAHDGKRPGEFAPSSATRQLADHFPTDKDGVRHTLFFGFEDGEDPWPSNDPHFMEKVGAKVIAALPNGYIVQPTDGDLKGLANRIARAQRREVDREDFNVGLVSKNANHLYDALDTPEETFYDPETDEMVQGKQLNSKYHVVADELEHRIIPTSTLQSWTAKKKTRDERQAAREANYRVAAAEVRSEIAPEDIEIVKRGLATLGITATAEDRRTGVQDGYVPKTDMLGYLKQAGISDPDELLDRLIFTGALEKVQTGQGLGLPMRTWIAQPDQWYLKHLPGAIPLSSAWDKDKHPRGQPGNAGEFVRRSSMRPREGITVTPLPPSETRATRTSKAKELAKKHAELKAQHEQLKAALEAHHQARHAAYEELREQAETALEQAEEHADGLREHLNNLAYIPGGAMPPFDDLDTAIVDYDPDGNPAERFEQCGTILHAAKQCIALDPPQPSAPPTAADLDRAKQVRAEAEAARQAARAIQEQYHRIQDSPAGDQFKKDNFDKFNELSNRARTLSNEADVLEAGSDDGITREQAEENKTRLQQILTSVKAARKALREWATIRKEMRGIRNPDEVSLSAAWSLSAARAPTGYTREKPLVIGGQAFIGGEFIPSAVLARATPAERAAAGIPATAPQPSASPAGQPPAGPAGQPAAPQATSARQAQASVAAHPSTPTAQPASPATAPTAPVAPTAPKSPAAASPAASKPASATPASTPAAPAPAPAPATPAANSAASTTSQTKAQPAQPVQPARTTTHTQPMQPSAQAPKASAPAPAPLTPAGHQTVERLQGVAQRNSEQQVNRLINSPGWTGPKDAASVQAALQKAYEKSEVTVNLNHSALPFLIKSGEIKNAFQTGTRPKDYMQQRARVEQEILGAGPQVSADDRPRYAAVNWGGRNANLMGAASVYGNVVCVLKKDRFGERMSTCHGNSFGAEDQSQLGSHSNIAGSAIFQQKALQAAGLPVHPEATPQYTEVHLWGRVGLDADSVAEFRMPSFTATQPHVADLVAYGAKHNIPVRFFDSDNGKNVTYEEAKQHGHAFEEESRPWWKKLFGIHVPPPAPSSSE